MQYIELSPVAAFLLRVNIITAPAGLVNIITAPAERLVKGRLCQTTLQGEGQNANGQLYGIKGKGRLRETITNSVGVFNRYINLYLSQYTKISATHDLNINI